MEETLKTLSELQIQALNKGISFDIDMYINDKKVPTTQVKMSYTVTGGIAKGFAFNTTFSDSLSKSKQENRIDEIKYFISTVTGPTNNE